MDHERPPQFATSSLTLLQLAFCVQASVVGRAQACRAGWVRRAAGRGAGRVPLHAAARLERAVPVVPPVHALQSKRLSIRQEWRCMAANAGAPLASLASWILQAPSLSEALQGSGDCLADCWLGALSTRPPSLQPVVLHMIQHTPRRSRGVFVTLSWARFV